MLTSAKSMGDDVARLDVLRDPKRMAALLARALSTSILEDTTNASAARRGSIEEEDEEVEKTQEEFQELGRRSGAEASGKNSSLNLMIQSAVDDDDDDAGEEDEEDEDEEKPLDEVELEAAAAALQTAARIVEQLRIKKALQTSQTTGNLQFNLEELMSVSLQRAQTNPLATGNGPGVPMPQALLRTNSTCCGCSKSFNPFHRSKSCASCGYAFCPRCSSKSFVLPTRFGYGEELMRTCDLCARWYQNALDRYFEAMELVTDQDHNSAIHRDSVIRENCPSVSSNSIIDPTPSAIKEIGSLVARRRFSVSSPTPVPCDEIVDDSCDNEDQLITSVSTTSFKRRHRFSSMSSSPSVNRTKPWFSGHLRAIHVNDRLPRKRRARGDSEGGETVNNSPNLLSQQSRSSSVTSSKSRYIDESAHDTRGQRTYLVENSPIDLQDGAYVVGASQSSHIKGKEPRLTTSEKPVVETVCTNSTRPQRKTRSKFSRSASFDLTNLHAAVSPISSLESPGMARSNTFGSDEGKMFALDVGSNGSGRSNSLRSQKAFDDSDIVDERAKLDSADVKLKSEAKLSAAVLRFAVYEMGGKESTGLRRTFGFAKANPVLDRYTLEFDCRQRIVRAKSVFLHRFWSFHCDSVQSFSFGTSDGMAHLIIFNGGQGNLSLKLKFANDDEREQFKQALDSCRSTTLERIREFATRNAMSLPAWPECPASPALDDIHSPTPPEPNTTYSANASTTVESELSLTHDTNCSITADFPMLQSIHVPLLPGEAVVKDTELQATLLIGPASETYESAQVWGRIRGKIAVTNYRVIFTPFDEVPVQSRCCGGQGGVAYIPLFGITHVQLLYPNGRRTKTGRSNYVGMAGPASIISISCKDFRIMRFQLDTHPSIAEDHAHKLRATIAKEADASQRYTVVSRGSPMRTTLSGIKIFSDFASDSDRTLDRKGSGEGNFPHHSKEPNLYSTLSSSRSSANAALPVLSSDPILTISREKSGSFALAYSIGNVPSDKNGWNLFVDEREFRRQIDGDPAVSSYLKFYKNDRGNICKTYPSKLLLPASTTSVTLAKVADFRAKNRLPVITYYHRRNRCVLTRSSQPLLGNLLSGTSNVSDQLLLGVYRRLPDIIKNQSQSSQSSRPLYIFDARKPKASTGNRLMGKGGVETPQDYPGAVVHHLNIANMYRMQSSYMGLMKLLLPGGVDDNDRTWLSSVESTRWLDHVRLVLGGALKIARVLESEGASALVHCSDGWDRTSQLCALAQLMIDPYYRTIRGFAVLVEKDWLAFGHKYAERCGSDRSRDPQRNKSSPVMLQFLDAVWQMQRQYPYSFEFNERFLLHLANSLTSGLYGTFMYDSRLQRDVNEVKSSTVSVWTPVLMKPYLYTTSNYKMHDGPIWPWVSCTMIRLWDSYFFQWHPKFYKCQWVCSLVSHGPLTCHDGKGASADNNREEDQHDQVSNLNSSSVKHS